MDFFRIPLANAMHLGIGSHDFMLENDISEITSAASMLSEEIGADGAAEIFRLFRTDAPARFEELARAILDGNLSEVRRVAHSIASICRTVGARSFASVMERAEDAALGGDPGAAREGCSQCRANLPALLQLIENVIKRLDDAG